uniref:Rhomboid domain-containing protein n=1 Tax=Trichuris muris TaxID=70415 RepID=A0A5S6QGZ0_TRIMR
MGSAESPSVQGGTAGAMINSGRPFGKCKLPSVGSRWRRLQKLKDGRSLESTLSPPVFIPLVTFTELLSYIYYNAALAGSQQSTKLPVDSLFIYRPDKRAQIWRFIFYILIHAGWPHLLCNLIIQTLTGVPLELVHGSKGTAAVYVAGVLAGSLATSIFSRDAYLVGASGGVYALMAAHVAHVLMNSSCIPFRAVRILSIALITLADTFLTIWNNLDKADKPEQCTSHVAHLAGSVAGLTTGLIVLKSSEDRLSDPLLLWIGTSLYVASVCTAIIWNIFLY